MKANPDSPRWPVRQRALEDGLLDADTPVATTVHELQVLEPETIPVTAHDVPLDLVVTPERTIPCEVYGAPPAGIHWNELTEEKIDAIPLLGRLRRARGGREG